MICVNKSKIWSVSAVQPPPQIEQIGRKRDEKMNNTRKGVAQKSFTVDTALLCVLRNQNEIAVG